MPFFIIDTNVGIVANGRSGQANPACVAACVDLLTKSMRGVVLLDELGLILDEYAKHFSYAGQPGLGDAFFKLVHEQQAVEGTCLKVPITPLETDPRMFDEFPSDTRLASFDPSDRKWVAVALAHGGGAPIYNAVDSDWWHFRVPLADSGVLVRLLCEDCIQKEL